MRRTTSLSFQPAAVDKTEGTDWAVYIDPRTREVTAARIGENAPGTIVVPRYRRVCRAVAQRAADNLLAVA